MLLSMGSRLSVFFLKDFHILVDILTGWHGLQDKELNVNRAITKAKKHIFTCTPFNSGFRPQENYVHRKGKRKHFPILLTGRRTET